MDISCKINGLALVLLLAMGLPLGGCYTAQELHSLAAAAPDPRQEQVDKLWVAMQSVVREEQWPVELERREDLIIATAWMEVAPALRRRVRFLVLVAPNGVGINVNVLYEQHDPRLPPEEAWAEATDPVLTLRRRQEEQALALRIQAKWQEGS